MAGIPPAVGFAAKLAVLQAAVEANLTWLAVFAVLFSVVGAFYYLRVIKLMFFDSPEEETASISISVPVSVLVAAIGILVLALGIFPGALLSACEMAAQTVL